MSGDLPIRDLAELDWSPQGVTGSLSSVHAHAVGLASAAEKWYAEGRPSKKRGARILRVGAILVGAVGLILPVLAEIVTRHGRAVIAPGWAAVVLAVAATLIGLDHFFGFSSGWMRFMTAELKITRLRLAFQYEWNAVRLTAAVPPTDDQVARLVDLARKLALDARKGR